MNTDKQRVRLSAFICVHLRLKLVFEHFSSDLRRAENGGISAALH
jgi:hypothetical protein